MTKQEFIKDMTYLGIAFNKEYSKEELVLYYDYLKNYADSTFKRAIREIIKSKTYLPKISELLETCNNITKQSKYEILEIMDSYDYFKDETEYKKAVKWLDSGIIPNWFKEDMAKFDSRGLLVDNKLIGERNGRENINTLN